MIRFRRVIREPCCEVELLKSTERGPHCASAGLGETWDSRDMSNFPKVLLSDILTPDRTSCAFFRTTCHKKFENTCSKILFLFFFEHFWTAFDPLWLISNMFQFEKRSTERTSFWSTYKRACGAGQDFPSDWKVPWETFGVRKIDISDWWNVQKGSCGSLIYTPPLDVVQTNVKTQGPTCQ